MAMGRHNRPAIMVYGGTILPGSPTCGTQNPAVADKIDIISAFQSYGQYLSKQINNEERIDIVKHACQGPVHVVVCTLPTLWPLPLKSWG